MRKKFVVASLAFLMTVARSAVGQQACPEGKVCVDKEDMAKISEVLKEKKCLLENKPKVSTSPLTIVIDRQDRIYGSGSQPAPFTVQLDWCNYSIEGQATTKIIAARMAEPTWGFRFRPKATMGILGTELLRGEKFLNTMDGGALLEPFYFHWVNLNAYVGLRSVGGGLGFDLTKNLGLFTGYSITWADWRSNPFVAISFALW